jgi:uncharacterized protein YdeI (YjbR/CyaY-like superfamily)
MPVTWPRWPTRLPVEPGVTQAPRAFRSAAALRTWLAANHRTTEELIFRCYKKHAAHRGVTYPEALDEVLCVGWIDGHRRSLDEDSYSIRLTPRKPRSIWSRVNVAHAERLIATERMTAAGLAVYRARDEARTGLYSFERAAMEFDPALARQFRAARSAWAFFQAQPPGYRKLMTYRVMSAKREATRARRLVQLIDASARHTRLY